MASKEDREAAINAKIAAIRAANEARERRHREVEADRLEAEKNKSAVTVKTEEELAEQDRFKNPYDSTGKVNKKPSHERPSPVSKPSPREEPVRRGRGRLADDDGPPPDPGYSFLADRMRDGSPEDEEQDKKGNKAMVSKTSRIKKEPLMAKRSGGGGRDRPFHQDEK